MDVDTDPLSFDQIRDQINGIQQANSNYEQSKNSCSRPHPQNKILKKKVKNLLIRIQDQDMQRFRIYERRILRII